MRQSAVSILLFVVACASPASSVPRSSTIYIAPTVRSRDVEGDLSRALVAEFDRKLRLGIDMVHVDAADAADYVIQPVVSFAAVEVTESKYYGDWIGVYWNETLTAAVTLTARADPSNPVIVLVRQSAQECGTSFSRMPFPMILRSLKGCQVDAMSGAVTAADGGPAWMPGIAHVEARTDSLWRSLGLPTKRIPRRGLDILLPEDPGTDVVFALADSLTTLPRIHMSGPGDFSSWQRLRTVLMALAARERLRDEVLDGADRRLLSSLFDRIAHAGGNDGEWMQAWDPASYAELYRWLVDRLRDDHHAFRTGYRHLLAGGIEPAFCKAVYERWPPNAGVFRNTYVPGSANLNSTPG